MMFEQDGGMAGVLGGNDIRFAQNAQGAQGDVFQIPDWAGNESEQLD